MNDDQKLGGSIDFSTYVRERTVDFFGRDWVFQKVDDWQRNSEQSRYLLITGEPGSGKTAIAGRLWQFASGRVPPPAGLSGLAAGFLSAVHFCFSRASSWVDPRSFAQSIALQLARTHQEFAEALVDVGDKQVNIRVQQSAQTVAPGAIVQGAVINNLDVSGLNPQDAFNRVVVDPLLTIYNQGFNEPVTILVDALDESLLFRGVTIPDLVARLAHLPERVRFVLTSRPVQEVERQLLEAEPFLLSSERFDQFNDRDVSKYLQHRLHNDSRFAAQAAAVDSQQREHIEEEIVRRAAGNFQYVTFLLREMETGSRAPTELEGLPRGLDALYYESLHRVVADRGQQDWKNGYAPLLSVLSVAREGLGLDELRHFTGQSEADVVNRLSVLQPFTEECQSVAGQDDEPVYRLYHQSVVDFLGKRYLQNGKRRLNSYLVSASDGDQRIVNYFRAGEKSWDDIKWQERPRDESHRRSRDYALKHLVQHAAKVAKSGEQANDGVDLYRLVLNKDFQTAQQTLGNVSLSLEGLRTAIDVALDRNDPLPALSCIGAFRETVSSRAISAGVFDAVSRGAVRDAIAQAAHYRVGPKASGPWSRALHCYLAWEAAEAGDERAVREAMAEISATHSTLTAPFCNALVACTARALELSGPPGRSASEWLAELVPNLPGPQTLLERLTLGRPLDAAEVEAIQNELDPMLGDLKRYIDTGEAEGISMVPFLDERLGTLM